MTKIQARGKWFVDEEAPPTRERVDPVADAWLNVYADGETHAHLTKSDADHYALPRVMRECIPLYRHPATIDDAIALLVRSGWVSERVNLSAHIGETALCANTRVLIAPTPERAS